MDGIEATPQIIAMGVTTPIIAMTANVMIEDVELYKKIGMKDHIGKPFTSLLLWSILLKYLKPVSFMEVKDPEPEQEDEIFKNQLKSDFVKSNQNRYNEIIDAFNSGDIKLAHRMTHTLKTNAGQIGKTALQKAAADVELSLKKDAALPGETQMNIFKAELSIALEELRPYLIETNNAAQPETAGADFDADKALRLFDKLEPLLKRGSPECLKYIGQLRQIPGSDKIIEQIEEFNFDIAADILKNIKKKMEGS
jgi:HPt (histidine-containing phosphotransfer) domain-containing protein